MATGRGGSYRIIETQLGRREERRDVEGDALRLVVCFRYQKQGRDADRNLDGAHDGGDGGGDGGGLVEVVLDCGLEARRRSLRAVGSGRDGSNPSWRMQTPSLTRGFIVDVVVWRCASRCILDAPTWPPSREGVDLRRSAGLLEMWG